MYEIDNLELRTLNQTEIKTLLKTAYKIRKEDGVIGIQLNSREISLIKLIYEKTSRSKIVILFLKKK